MDAVPIGDDQSRGVSRRDLLGRGALAGALATLVSVDPAGAAGSRQGTAPATAPSSDAVAILSAPNHFTNTNQFDQAVGFGVAPGTYSPFDYLTTETQFQVGRPVGFHIGTTVAPTQMVSQYTDFHSIDNLLTSTFAFDGTQTVRLYALESYGQYGGTGHINQIVSVYGYGKNTGAGTVDEISNFRAQVGNQGTGTVTLGRGYYVNLPLKSAGRIVTFAGVYMDDLTGVADTTYSIYCAGGQSYHAGGIGIGGGNTGKLAGLVDIRGSATATALYIRPPSGQTGEFVAMTDDRGNKVVRFMPASITSAPALVMDWYSANLPPKAMLALRPTSGVTPIYVRSPPAQVADIAQFRDSNDNTKVRISPHVYLTTLQNAAPLDTEIGAGEVAFWLDPTDGACKMMFTAKQANGAVRTGAVGLT